MKTKILFSTVDSGERFKSDSTLKFFLTMSLILIAILGFASPRASAFQVSLWNKSPFIIEFDGKRYSSDCDFVLKEVKAGSHQLRVYSKEQHQHGGHVTIHFDGCVEIPINSKVISEITRNHDLKIIDIIRFNRPPAAKPIVRPVPRPRPQDDCSPRPIHCGTAGNHHGQVYNNDDHYYGSGGAYNDYGYHSENDDYDYGHYDSNVISDYELEKLLEDLTAAWKDDERLQLATNAVQNNRLNTEQVISILDTFWNEESRLEFAIFAYERVTDPENYEMVNDVFWSSASVRELEDYISNDTYTYNH